MAKYKFVISVSMLHHAMSVGQDRVSWMEIHNKKFKILPDLTIFQNKGNYSVPIVLQYSKYSS